MFELRKLELRDLNDIERIERESYPTPWSRSMFAGELAKPSSLSLGAFDPDTGVLVGYLVISRYVDAWHVMNVAVTGEYRRRGIARALLERLFVVTSSDERRRGLVAGRLQAEDHPASACSASAFWSGMGSRHMISASSRLSV